MIPGDMPRVVTVCASRLHMGHVQQIELNVPVTRLFFRKSVTDEWTRVRSLSSEELEERPFFYPGAYWGLSSTDLLGKGSWGSVWALEPPTGHHLALKVIEGNEMYDVFDESIHCLFHPGPMFVRTHHASMVDMGKRSMQTRILMDRHTPLQTLWKRLQQTVSLDDARLTLGRLLRQLVADMVILYERGWMCIDVSLSNICFDEERSRLVLVDHGSIAPVFPGSGRPYQRCARIDLQTYTYASHPKMPSVPFLDQAFVDWLDCTMVDFTATSVTLRPRQRDECVERLYAAGLLCVESADDECIVARIPSAESGKTPQQTFMGQFYSLGLAVVALMYPKGRFPWEGSQPRHRPLFCVLPTIETTQDLIERASIARRLHKWAQELAAELGASHGLSQLGWMLDPCESRRAIASQLGSPLPGNALTTLMFGDDESKHGGNTTSKNRHAVGKRERGEKATRTSHGAEPELAPENKPQALCESAPEGKRSDNTQQSWSDKMKSCAQIKCVFEKRAPPHFFEPPVEDLTRVFASATGEPAWCCFLAALLFWHRTDVIDVAVAITNEMDKHCQPYYIPQSALQKVASLGDMNPWPDQCVDASRAYRHQQYRMRLLMHALKVLQQAMHSAFGTFRNNGTKKE